MLDFIKSKKTITMGCGRLTQIVSKNKQIQIWHHQLEYANNVKVVRVSKLVNKINIDNIKYNPKEVFINSNLSKTDEQSNIANKNFAPLVDLDFSSSTLRNIMSDFDQLYWPCIRSKSTLTIL